MRVDLAVMTGNVAQVFLTDDTWNEALTGLSRALPSAGHLVFETRNPEYRVWEKWAAEPAIKTIDIAGVGQVRHRFDVTEGAPPYVSFRDLYTFPDDTKLSSDSTLGGIPTADPTREIADHASANDAP